MALALALQTQAPLMTKKPHFYTDSGEMTVTWKLRQKIIFPFLPILDRDEIRREIV